jgi:uncharacterized surface protein with fasciclin (FAS1) repeats
MNDTTPQTPNSKMTMYIVIAIVAVLAVAGTAYALSMNNSSNSDDKNDSSSSVVKSSEVMKSASTVSVGGGIVSSDKNIVENAIAVPVFSTLVAATQAADLVTTLQGPGPFTVFAPANDAFTKLPAGTVETLLQPENKAQLQGILTYHVVSGKILAADLKDGQIVKTVQGGNLKVTKIDGKVMINGATVQAADAISSNGVIHVIDSVLLPEQSVVEIAGVTIFANKNLVENAIAVPSLSTLVAAVTAGDLVTTLQGPGPFTVFAPDNAAFAKLPAGTVETLVKPESKKALVNILTYHVVAGKFLASDLKDGQLLKTVQGENITVVKTGNTISLKDAKGVVVNIVASDAIQSNGVAHIIDTVLTPAK